MKMTSEQLNQWLSDHSDVSDDNDFEVAGCSVHGKLIPYYGWFWRFIDFDGTDTLGWDGDAFVGFMGNNKWGYASYWTTDEEMAEIRKRAVQLASEPLTQEAYQAFYDYLQTFKVKFTGGR